MPREEEYRRSTDVAIARIEEKQASNSEKFDVLFDKLDTTNKILRNLPCGAHKAKVTVLQWVMGLLIVVGVPGVIGMFYHLNSLIQQVLTNQ